MPTQKRTDPAGGPASLVRVAIADLRPNPFRRLEEYPIDRDKVSTLMASFAATGIWTSITGRPAPTEPDKVEIAFGHHRLVALKETYPARHEVEIIVRDLSDADMLRMMAHENMEEWSGTAWAELETIRATIEAYAQGHITLPSVPEKTNKDKIRYASAGTRTHPYTKGSVAQFLGWTSKHKEGVQPNQACEFAFKALDLADLGELDLADLKGLTRTQGEKVVESAWENYRLKEQWKKHREELEQQEARRLRQDQRDQREYQRACKQIASLLAKTVANGATAGEADSARHKAEELMAAHGISATEARAGGRPDERAPESRPYPKQEGDTYLRQQAQEAERSQQRRHAEQIRAAVAMVIGERPWAPALDVLKASRDELEPKTLDRLHQALTNHAARLLKIRDFLCGQRPEPGPGPGTEGGAPGPNGRKRAARKRARQGT
jgi:hypothetical protein